MRKIIMVLVVIAAIMLIVGCANRKVAPQPAPVASPAETPQPSPTPEPTVTTPPPEVTTPPSNVQSAPVQSPGLDIADTDLNNSDGPSDIDIGTLTEPTPDTSS